MTTTTLLCDPNTCIFAMPFSAMKTGWCMKREQEPEKGLPCDFMTVDRDKWLEERGLEEQAAKLNDGEGSVHDCGT